MSGKEWSVGTKRIRVGTDTNRYTCTRRWLFIYFRWSFQIIHRKREDILHKTRVEHSNSLFMEKND